MITFALLTPSQSQSEEQGSFEPFQEILKNVVSLADVFAIYYALNYLKTGSGESILYKLLAITLGISAQLTFKGWAGLQSFLSYFFYLLINAFSSEFQWECIQTSVLSNVELVSIA